MPTQSISGGGTNKTLGSKNVVNASVASRRSQHAGNSIAINSTVSKSKFGNVSSRTILSSSKSGKNLGESGKEKTVFKAPVHVIDPDTGKDVTPQPLLSVNRSLVRKNQSNLLMDQNSQAGTPTDLQSQVSIYQGTINASTMFGGGPFTRSVFSASGAASDSDTIVSDDVPLETGSHHGVGAVDISSWGQIQREDVREDLKETDLTKAISITLHETATIWLIDINGTCYSNESSEASVVKQKNEKYLDLCKSRAGNDLYTERGMVTFNDAPKLKAVQTDKINYMDISVTASLWDMYDTFKMAKELEDLEDGDKNADITIGGRPTSSTPGDANKAGLSSLDDLKMDQSKVKRSLHKVSTTKGTIVSKIVEESDILSSVVSMPGQNAESAEEMQKEIQLKKNEQILSSDSLKQSLFVMERLINLNSYQTKLACYRGFEPYYPSENPGAESVVVDPSKGSISQGPNLERLWCYLCPLTKGKNVSCMAWNRANPDLIAIGYGQYEFVNQKGGLIACWSLKNPEYPERIYHSEIGVTALDFSQTKPHLLAVGLYDGTIAVFNIKVSGSDPILDTFECNQRHTSPVWQLHWIEKDKGKGDDQQAQEVLISISADGRVCQWTIRKGFECADLMKLKRVQLKQHVGGKVKNERKADALISRLAGGFCFAFSQLDPMMYIAGTEEGYIHKCSCSYNEQYLDTFEGHVGPVYDLKWSPFCKDVFLSCSADWSIRLWRHDRLKPILSFFSSTKSVNSVSWSPYCSTVFACVNDFAVEVWDLAQSSLDPVIVATSSGPKMSSVAFAANSESILVGDSTGQVLVYQLKGMPRAPENQEEALNKIISASLASQLQEEDSQQALEAKKQETEVENSLQS